MRAGAYKRVFTSWSSLKRVIASFLQAFGVIALFLGVLVILFPNTFQNGLAGLVVFSVISLAWAAVANRPLSVISRQFSAPDTTVTIRVGDLFDQDANLVIGMTDVFDTEKGDIIKPTSVQGQFLTRVYGDDRPKLDRDLEHALYSAGVEPIAHDHAKVAGKSARYPIGTVATIRLGAKLYFCVAYSQMGSDLQARCTLRWLSESLDNLWEAVRAKGQRERVAMAVLGSDLARLGHQASHTNLIMFIASSFILTSREKSVTRELVIVVHPGNAGSVNFADLDDFLRTF